MRSRFRFRIPATLVSLLAIPLALGSPATSRAEIVRDPLWITDGEVRAVAYKNNTIFLGGQFSKVGPAIGGLGTFDTSGGAAIPPFAGVAGTVNAFTSDGTGGYYIGGVFTGVKGQARNNLAHIDPAGNVTSWNPGANGPVHALLVHGSSVYVAGEFNQVGGQLRPFLASVDAATGAPTAWLANPGAYVKTMFSNGSTLYVGGLFHSMSGAPRHLVAAFDLTSGSLTSWAPAAETTGGIVEMIRGLGDLLYIGGNFFFMGGQFRNSLAAVSATTGLATGFNAFLDFGDTVHDIAITQQSGFPPTTTVWIGGSFDNVGGAFRPNLAGLDAATSAVNGFNPGTNGTVRSILVRTHNLTGAVTAFYAAGDFTTIAGASRPYLASLTSAGAATAWDARPNAPVRKILFAGATIVAGGAFTSAQMTTRANLAALDATTGAVTPWNPGVDGPVNALLLHGTSSLYVGGAFGLIGTDPRGAAAEIDIHSGFVSPWNPSLACTDFTCFTATVNAIARASNSSIVYLGGDFKESWGQIRRNLVATDATTGAPLAFNVNANFPVRSISLQERQTFPFEVISVFAGGAFNTVNAGLHGAGDGGVVREHVAAFDGATGQVQAWNPSTNLTSSVHSVTFTSSGLFGGTVWIGGEFPSMGGASRNNAAAVDAGTGVATGWNPDANGAVRAILLRGEVFLGGDFTTVGGQPRNRLASVTGASGAVTSWDPDGNGSVHALGSYGGTIFAGGAFTRVSNHPHAFFAGIGDGVVTGIEPEPASDTPPAPALAYASPNPFRDHTRFRFRLARREVAQVSLYDVAGRLVRELHDGVLDAGEHVMEWNGRDARGRAVGSGIYFFRAESRSERLGVKVFRLR